MIKGINHVTIVVSQVNAAIEFFTLLGFKQKHAEVLRPEVIESSMGIRNTLGADHISLSLEPELEDSFEIQLLHYRGTTPQPLIAASDKRAFKLGYDHIAFEVSNIVQILTKLCAHGIVTVKEPFIVGKKKLAFIEGPEGITIELAELL